MGAGLEVPQVGMMQFRFRPSVSNEPTWDGEKAFKSDCAGSQVCRWCDDRTTCAGKKAFVVGLRLRSLKTSLS